MLEGKTILVTGATGLLGSHLVGECLDRGARVIALGRRKEKLESCFAKYLDHPDFECIAADVSEFPLPEDPIDYVFHAAGPIERTVIEKTPLQVIEPNVFATKRLLDMLYGQKKTLGISGRMVVFSSSTVYGSPNMRREGAVAEQDTEFTEGLDSYNAPYSQSKRMAEVLARAYWKQFGVDVVIGRFGYLYGYNTHHAMTAFFEFMDRASHGEPIIIHSTRLARRDNIYVSDAVSGLLTIALKGQPGETYNISANAQEGNYAAVDEMANIMAELAGPPVRVVSDGPIEHLPGLILDNRKLGDLGWSLQTDIKSGIAAVFEEYKRNV